MARRDEKVTIESATEQTPLLTAGGSVPHTTVNVQPYRAIDVYFHNNPPIPFYKLAAASLIAAVSACVYLGPNVYCNTIDRKGSVLRRLHPALSYSINMIFNLQMILEALSVLIESFNEMRDFYRKKLLFALVRAVAYMGILLGTSYLASELYADIAHCLPWGIPREVFTALFTLVNFPGLHALWQRNLSPMLVEVGKTLRCMMPNSSVAFNQRVVEEFQQTVVDATLNLLKELSRQVSAKKHPSITDPTGATDVYHAIALQLPNLKVSKGWSISENMFGGVAAVVLITSVVGLARGTMPPSTMKAFGERFYTYLSGFFSIASYVGLAMRGAFIVGHQIIETLRDLIGGKNLVPEASRRYNIALLAGLIVVVSACFGIAYPTASTSLISNAVIKPDVNALVYKILGWFTVGGTDIFNAIPFADLMATIIIYFVHRSYPVETKYGVVNNVIKAIEGAPSLEQKFQIVQSINQDGGRGCIEKNSDVFKAVNRKFSGMTVEQLSQFMQMNFSQAPDNALLTLHHLRGLGTPAEQHNAMLRGIAINVVLPTIFLALLTQYRNAMFGGIAVATVGAGAPLVLSFLVAMLIKVLPTLFNHGLSEPCKALGAFAKTTLLPVVGGAATQLVSTLFFRACTGSKEFGEYAGLATAAVGAVGCAFITRT